MKSIPWHSQSIEACLKQLGTNLLGLSPSEAEKRLSCYGENVIQEKMQASFWQKWMKQFNSLLITILLLTAIITALLQHWIDMSVILGVVLLNAVMGYFQESKAEKAMQALKKMLSLQATVMRDNRRMNIAAKALVPGDIILLRAGDKIPADLRLVKAHSLQINEAMLTGESLPVEKSTDPIDQTTLLTGRRSMAYSGTFVTYGVGAGIVVSTGQATEVGKISTLLAQPTHFSTPLLRQITIFSRWLALIIVIVSLIAFFIGIVVRHYPLEEMFMAAVAIVVAIIPEGLPAIITITLAVGVARMARHHTIIRQLAAVEILSAVSVICTDKTGTLTKNELVVKKIITCANQFEVTGSGYNDQGTLMQQKELVKPEECADLSLLIRAGMLCNEAELTLTSSAWHLIGHPVDGALLALGLKAKFNLEEETAHYPMSILLPFDSQHKLMASLHQHVKGGALLFVKGAPEKILTLSCYQMNEQEKETIDSHYWQYQINQLAQQGMKVLALAYQPIEKMPETFTLNSLSDTLIFLGIVGIMDTPRQEVSNAILTCQQAGIEVKMITGDHFLTAKAVGKQVGITGEQILTGQEMDNLSTDQLYAVIHTTNIFARTVPEHKLRLIKALKKNHAVVAMTGDGVNDAPALRHADIGIAMGIKGAEVAKEASQMVLADDNFASIVQAVKEARHVYNKLKKTLLFILPTNGGEGLTIFFSILLGSTLPITPLQILWVNMVTAITLGLALAFEPAEKSLMRQKPRNPKEPLLSKLLLWRMGFISLLFVCALFGLFLYSSRQGCTITVSRTMVVDLLVLLEVVYLINCRQIYGSSLNRSGLLGSNSVLIAIGTVLLLQMGFTYLPFMQYLFDSQPINGLQWIMIAFIALLIFFMIEFEKMILRQLSPLFLKELR